MGSSLNRLSGINAGWNQTRVDAPKKLTDCNVGPLRVTSRGHCSFKIRLTFHVTLFRAKLLRHSSLKGQRMTHRE